MRLIIVSLMVLAGCAPSGDAEGNGKATKLKIANAYLETVAHDGHIWMVGTKWGYGGMSVVHHPDCPCGKR